jgi:hypothetical protein
MIRTGWIAERGYRGTAYWCYRGQLHAVVRENISMRHRRFEVYHWSRLESRHETLPAAKRRVLELLKEGSSYAQS